MTGDQAAAELVELGRAEDDAFPLLEAAIACALHDYPLRDADPTRRLVREAAERARRRLDTDSPEDALTETLGGELGLTGDLMTLDHPANTDVIAATTRRTGVSALLGVFYLEVARGVGIQARGVDFPNHFLLRVETPEGPVALDPFSHGRVVLPSELTQRALRAGLTPDVADRLDQLMAPISDRQALVRLQNLLFIRAMNGGDPRAAERAALRCALLEPRDRRAWLDVAAARERQGALAGALEALDQARGVAGGVEALRRGAADRLRLRLN